MKAIFVVLFIFALCSLVFSLDNGLARTPPMGWMSWAKFYCEVDCAHHRHSCINEQLYKEMADRLVEDGYRDVGYNSVHIDDCWTEMQRDGRGRLVANRTRFPSGISALTEYMHGRGLKLGIYADIGTETCGKYPGSWKHYEVDAQTFADWKVDYLKFDGCNLNISLIPEAYPKMAIALNRTGHPIAYSCAWPLDYDLGHTKQEKINYTAIGFWCNLWRNFDDVERSWASVFRTINFYNKYQEIYSKSQGPGRWNDPDMLIIGNTELTIDQAKVQMSIWAIWSAPLIMSNDLRTMAPGHREILLNKRVIAVDQDPLGTMGTLVYKGPFIYVYTKEMTPIVRSRYSHAIAVLNHGFLPILFSTNLKSIGLKDSGGYSLQDLWSGEQLGHFSPLDIYNVTLAPTSVAMLKANLA